MSAIGLYWPPLTRVTDSAPRIYFYKALEDHVIPLPMLSIRRDAAASKRENCEVKPLTQGVQAEP